MPSTLPLVPQIFNFTFTHIEFTIEGETLGAWTNQVVSSNKHITYPEELHSFEM